MNVQEKATQLAKWIVDAGIEGLPPVLASAEALAAEYQSDATYVSNDQRVTHLIRWETSKNFTSGALANLAGTIALPVMIASIPAALGTSWALQARMAAVIAKIHGHDIREDRVRTLVLLSLVGDRAKEVLKGAGVVLGQKVAQSVLQQVPGRLLIEINKKIGFRLLTKAGETGVINLAKWIPFVGAPIGGTFDAVACQVVGEAARSLFREG